MQTIIAIDIGTTNCKAITINKQGKVTHACKAGYPVIAKLPGQSEQEPEVIFKCVIDILKRAIKANIQNEVNAVSFSAAMHSVMAVDKTGKPLTNAITWADTRSKLYAEQLLEDENYDRLYKQTGTPVHPMSPLCKIMLIRNEMPGVFTNTYKFISLKEYVFFRLFGKYIVDHSIASATGLFDIYNLTWYDVALQTAGITDRQLSTPVAVTHAETELLPEYKKLFSTAKPIPFIAGGNDGCLANPGSGAVLDGEVALTIGTSGAVRMTSTKIKPDDKKRLFNYLLTDRLYVTGGPINNGGIVLQWLRELLCAENTDALIQLAKEAKDDAGKLIFLPYLSGERAPFWDANARGVFFGLQMQHTKEHIAKAALEGICFALYDILVAMEQTNEKISNIYVSGGFIESKFWLQLLADIFNKKIIVSNAEDASATGAAYIAMLALGWIKDLTEVKQFLKEEEVFTCNKEAHKMYSRLFSIFQSLYPKLKDSFRALEAVSKEL